MSQIKQAINNARKALEECNYVASLIEQKEGVVGDCEYVDGLYEWFALEHETFLERIGELIHAAATIKNDKQTEVPTS